MKKIFNFLAILGLITLGSFVPTNIAHAEEGGDSTPSAWLQVSPTALVVTLQGGDVISGTSTKCPEGNTAGCAITVKNIGSESFQYKVYATPYVVMGENHDVSFSESASNSYTQISRWITFQDASGNYLSEITNSIAPGETQLVYYRIDVPEDVPGGAQYAAIWAQTLPKGATQGTGVQAVSRAGTVVRGRSIGETRMTLDVKDVEFTRFTFGGNLVTKATLKNTGNADFDAHYSYTAKNLFGKELYKDEGNVATYPDTEYHIETTWENTPLLGIFFAEFTINAAGENITETHLVAIIPVFVIVLLILLLTIIIVWIIIIIRKRKERKARTLV